MADEKKAIDLPITDEGLEVQFGSHTVGWYRHAAWFAQKIWESGVLAEHIKTPQRAFAILCKGDELGLPPFAAWGWIYPTKAGRLAIQTKGALAVVQSKASFEDYAERIEQEGTPEMRAVAVATRRGHKPVIKEFSLKDAEVAGLLKERRNREGERYDSTYQSFLKDMLLSRARGRALDIAWAAELGGIPIEGVAEDADMMEERRNPPERPKAAPPRRDPLLAQVGQKALAPGNVAQLVSAKRDEDVLDPALVKVIEQQVAEMWPKDTVALVNKDGTVAGVITNVGSAPTSTAPAGGRRAPDGRTETSPAGDTGPCPRCKSARNEMGGCDTCGWPGKDLR